MINRRVYPLDQTQAVYCAYARGALYLGVLGLGLTGSDEVLMPDYICNVALAPFHEAGVPTQFYKINTDLTPDWEDVRRKLTPKTKALVIVNYFGFPNQLDQARMFCDQHGLFMIEDNAHGFLSQVNGRPLGSWGDISVFAFHKTLMLPAAAALVINNKAVCRSLESPIGRAPSTSIFLLRELYRGMKKAIRYPLDAERLVRDIQPSDACKSWEYDLRSYHLPMPLISRWILASINADQVRQRRRNAYQRWVEYFECNNDLGVKVMFPRLEEGVCPYIFPVYVSDRKKFVQVMANKQVAAAVWPYMPQGSMEKDLSEHVMFLRLW